MDFNELTTLGSLRINSWNIDRLRKQHPLTYLFWEATLNCNFDCLHCGSSAGRNKHFNNELTTEEIKKVFKSISNQTDAKKVMVAITGGEPLLRKDIFEVMGYAHSLGFSWGMVTNGSLVTAEVVEKMKKSGMSTVVVSIDGIGKVHDDFRQTPGSYQKAIQAIKLLVNSGAFKDVQITTTVHPKNFCNLEKMAKEFTLLGINSWRLINVDPIGRAKENPEIILSDDQLQKLIKFIETKRKESFNFTYGCTGFLGPKHEGKIRDWFFYCSTGITTGSILYNGDIFVCPNVPRRPELIQGNVRKDDFYQTWQNKFDLFRKKDRTIGKECSECQLWKECRGGSFHLWDFEHNQPQFCHWHVLNGL